eukprot:gene36309-44046_t
MLDNREIDVKLPLLQFYFDNTLVSEIVYGTDPVSAETKLCSALKSITRGVEELVEHSSIVNIYSDDHLQDTLQGDYNYLLKLYENNCAKCRQFEESFLALHGTYGNKVVFLQARASDVPAHTQRTYLSLTASHVPVATDQVWFIGDRWQYFAHNVRERRLFVVQLAGANV